MFSFFEFSLSRPRLRLRVCYPQHCVICPKVGSDNPLMISSTYMKQKALGTSILWRRKCKKSFWGLHEKRKNALCETKIGRM